MKERMLVIGYDSPAAPEQKRGWACGGVRPYYAESIRKAAKELDGGTGYSLVLISGRVNVMDAVRTVRQVSNVPILVIRKQYDGMEKIAVLESGADEYIQCPIRLEEGMASVRALIRRYTKWNPCNGYVGCEPSKEGLCIIPEYRKVFVNRRELFFRAGSLTCYIRLFPGRGECLPMNSFFIRCGRRKEISRRASCTPA